MNANHARPMLAFWVLAAAAALITSFGLHDAGSTVTVHAGSPSSVSRSGSPELVLGGLLRSVPSVQPTSASRLGALSASAVEYAARTAATATVTDHDSVSAPTARKKKSTPSSVSTRTTTASATTSSAPRPGRGHHHGSGSTTTTVTATATTSPTSPPSTSPGKGRPTTPAQGSGGPGKSSGH